MANLANMPPLWQIGHKCVTSMQIPANNSGKHATNRAIPFNTPQICQSHSNLPFDKRQPAKTWVPENGAIIMC